MTASPARINYVIATYGGVNPKRMHSHPPPADVLKEHLRRLSSLQCRLSQVTIMKPEVEGPAHESYYDLSGCTRELGVPVVVHECENFGYSGGQFLRSYEIDGASFDYYIFIEDDLCPNVDHFDSLLQAIYVETFAENIGLLCGVVEGNANFADGGFPIHWEGCAVVSNQSLEQLYEQERWEGDPRRFLDLLDSTDVSCFDSTKTAYPGAYYQLTFSHLFTLSGVEHREYVEMEAGGGPPLMVPYWSDVKDEIWFYKKGGTLRRDYVYDDVLNSPLVPVQLLTEEGFFNNASPQASAERRRAVFVIGMRRCGTSLLMSCLAELGCSLGKTKNQDYDWQNPKGYFENDATLEIHKELLAFNSNSWSDVTRPKLAYTDEHVAAYRALLRSEFAGDHTIAIKDPRLTFFIDFVIEACSDFHLKFLFCTRDRTEATTSLAKAQNKSMSLVENLYDVTHEVLEQYVPGKNLMVVDHHDLLYDHLATMEKIAAHCSLEPRDTSNLVDIQLYRNRGRRSDGKV